MNDEPPILLYKSVPELELERKVKLELELERKVKLELELEVKRAENYVLFIDVPLKPPYICIFYPFFKLKYLRN